MTRKSLFTVLAIIILCLCCGTTFATDNKTTNLGNEIMDSMNKTGDSVKNVVSGNAIKDAGNGMKEGIENTGNMVKDGMNDMKNGIENMGNDMNRDDRNVNRENAGAYNAVRTETEGVVSNTGLNTMTTTTWMWIILVVAAVIIIAAIWYYATQNNS